MKKTIVSTNWLNKVIAAAMMMAITTAMPTMAGNRNHRNHDRKTTVVVVTNSHRGAHFDRVDKRTSHWDNHRHHAYRPVVETCTFRVSRHAVARAARIHGVLGAYWNPRTREMTVRYDARVTSARHIMHLVA